MEWIIIRRADGKFLSTGSLYVNIAGFARRFKSKKQAEAYMEFTELDKAAHTVRLITERESKSCTRPLMK